MPFASAPCWKTSSTTKTLALSISTAPRITENTRAAYPIEYIANAKVPCVGGHPTNIIFLTCDAFGVHAAGQPS